MQTHRIAMAVFLAAVATGCSVSPPAPGTPSLANSARDQISHLAVRGPAPPDVSLTSKLDGKATATGKMAMSAGLSWLGGTMEVANGAAGAGSDGATLGLLVVAFGLVTTPLAVASGAAYGAAAADSPEAVTESNAAIARSLDFVPAQLRQVLESELTASSPVPFEFVAAEAGDAELLAAGFDSVLDIEMKRIASQPTADRIQVSFRTEYEFHLRNLKTGQLLATRSYWRELEPRSVSSWAKRDAAPLTTALNESFSEVSSKTIEELFLAPAIRVQGLEPVSRGGFGTSSIPGTRPMFVWTALDGGSAEPENSVEYEILISTRKDKETLRHRTHSLRYIPPEPLSRCTTYQWQVRALYSSFGEDTATDWTPKYRFRTECRR